MQSKVVDVGRTVSIRASQAHVVVGYTTKCISSHPFTVSYVSDWLYVCVCVCVQNLLGSKMEQINGRCLQTPFCPASPIVHIFR